MVSWDARCLICPKSTGTEVLSFTPWNKMSRGALSEKPCKKPKSVGGIAARISSGKAGNMPKSAAACRRPVPAPKMAALRNCFVFFGVIQIHQAWSVFA
jgi:hypothetical protein